MSLKLLTSKEKETVINKDMPLKMLFNGSPGTGKTILASSFAEFGKMLYVTFDGKIESIPEDRLELMDILKVPLHEDARVAYKDFEAYLSNLAKGNLQYKYLVIDPLSYWSRCMLESIEMEYNATSKKGHKMDGRQLHGQGLAYWNKLAGILSLLLSKGCSIILTDHIHEVRDITKSPALEKTEINMCLPGQLKQRVAGWVHIQGYTFVEPIGGLDKLAYSVRFAPEERIKCAKCELNSLKRQILRAKEINFSAEVLYERIGNYVKERKEGLKK